ncbi:hypothetical protein ITJ57_01820 [Plantibacter sp. VKM Ac-2880]|uniref:hypothetical protein n=1 Tax=Plantibacter sp. VKM Ac-2880 TaxID=2783827 RepID=UPI00188F4079|nr:hypothetical protein [Plantibacter sp. VKM Ac-2880]MBF4567489.1 hypothetical protein [Plantibacter sp. VKM Ac-2880]
MSRLEILYDGELYTVPADESAYRAKVLELVSDGGFHWLEVNRGEGRLEPISLLIGPGIPIAIGALEPHPRADDGEYTAHVEEP